MVECGDRHDVGAGEHGGVVPTPEGLSQYGDDLALLLLEEGLVGRAPHIGTISKWRAIVDGSLVLFSRRKIDAAGPGQHARRMMVDGSGQRVRHF